jgi:hypothetical protein
MGARAESSRDVTRVAIFDLLPLIGLLALFAGAAEAVWVAGIRPADATDVFSSQLRLGQALGGLTSRVRDEPPGDRDHGADGARSRHRIENSLVLVLALLARFSVAAPIHA